MTDSGPSVIVGTRVRAASAVPGTVREISEDGKLALVSWDNGLDGWHTRRGLVVL